MSQIRRRNVRLKMSNSRSGPPPKATVVLAGSYDYSAASSGSYGEIPVKLNSPRDFMGSSGTQNAGYFTHYASIYRFYRVTAAKIQIKCRLSSTSGTPTPTAMHGDVVLWPGITPGSVSTMHAAASNKWSKQSTFGGEQRSVLTLQCSMRQLVGNNFDSSPLYRCTVTSDPTDLWYWFVSFQSRAYTNVNVDIDVQVWYTVEFSDLNTASISVTKFHDLAYRAAGYQLLTLIDRRNFDEKEEAKRVEAQKAEFDELSKQLNVLLSEPAYVPVPDPPSVKSLKLKLERKI